VTHDELLAKIEASGFVQGKDYVWSLDGPAVKKANAALRAVVELHKPIEEDGKLWCQHEACYNHIEFLERDDCDCDYPCPTIEAIEKELSA